MDLVGLRYIPPTRGCNEPQRTQRAIDSMQVKLITQNLEEPKFSLAQKYSATILALTWYFENLWCYW